MKKSLFLLLFSFFSLIAYNQTCSVSGIVLDGNSNPVYFSNVVLYASLDSSIVKVEYSGEEGDFQISGIAAGSYYVETTYVGYKNISTPVFNLVENQNLELEPFELTLASNELDQITVVAKKPLLEMKPNKLVMNVEGSINASGSDAFNLLRQSPGVVIDNNDNIFMLGKSGLQIYIDNRPTQLAGSDLAEYLKTIPSAEIESIEIITNPSAKYEAEGNAGIINIRLRRDKSLGANGNINTNYSIGQKARYNATLSGTYKTKKWNTYGSLTGYKGEGQNPFNIHREQLGIIFDQKSLGINNWEGFNSRLGVDYALDEKSTFGILVNGSKNAGGGIQNSVSDIYKKGATQIDSSLIAMSDNDRMRNNWNINGNYKYADKDGRSLNIDLDYGRYNKDSEEFQPNRYELPNGTKLSSKDFLSITPTNIDIATLKLDYEQKAFGGNLGLGLKVSNVITDNTFDFYNVIDGDNILDIERSNQFQYDEMVNAGYLSYSTQVNKLGIQAGLRVEHTHSKGTLTAMIPSDNEIVERDYIDFFPSLGITFQPDQKNSFQLSYSRRLNRPSYQDMNPFRSRLDELTFEQGNPFLNPEYTNNIQLSHSWNYKLNTTLSYSHTKDLITRITDTTDIRSAYITWLNLADQYAYSINVSAPIPINDWWNTYTSITGVRTHNKADFGDGKLVDLKATTFNIYSQQSFTLPKGFAIEISGWYNSPSIWGGTFEMDAMWSLSAGIQKRFLNDKLNVKIGVDDIFLSTNWRGTSDFGALLLNIDGRNDSRRLKVNMSYRFGNQQVKARKRKTGIEDEKSRIKNES